MTFSVLDWVIVVLAIGFMVGGYRRGFVSSLLSLVGFIGGAAAGVQLAPAVATRLASGRTQTVVAVAVVIAAALLGQIIAVTLGSALRNRMTWRPARTADSILGALVSLATVLIVVWMVAAPLASAPYRPLSSAVRRSEIVRGVNSAMPMQVREVYRSLRDTIDRGRFPDVFGPLAPTRVVAVPAPDPTLVADPVVRTVRRSVVKVVGVASSCSRRIEGSGFVYAPGRVMTNAHVVAGVGSPTVTSNGISYPATVVLYDPNTDIAVLAVRSLPAAPLHFDRTAAGRGDPAIILGFPEDGPFFVGAARVRERQQISGPNIYDDDTVSRQVYAVRGDVRPGDSGGPLLDTNGGVLGVVFASATDQSQTGFALTAAQVRHDASLGDSADSAVGTGSCD